ncbi:efflux RND transporter periplasmic adaptor subunit [Sulfuritalea sp.]|uniref:efflux RND transporter periplasmic adaptor subunit n=1 Tax=Sulfuritalea sp. TaxID=2480090 RepID=UPI00286E60D9|nr:efflux RND transporter periplasmic adaptor subunit [Sulfuritalea sp.]
MKYYVPGVVTALLFAVGSGYWVGTKRVGAGDTATMAAAPAPASVAGDAAAQKPRKLLYYRNPMGLADTSPTPKKDSMGMDYIAVYEGEDEGVAAGELKISTEKVQKLGVKTEPAALRELARQVRAAGRVEIDERRLHNVAPKFEGWVERLHVNATGQPVAKGQPLFEVYSPELVSAQREYVVAAKGVAALKDASSELQSGMRQLAEASLVRLRNWDISEEQIKALAGGGEARRTLSFRSPVSGVVLEKKAVAGMRFMPGEMLYQIADLSAIWVLADVFEQDIGLVKVGAGTTVRINSYPDKNFKGVVTYVYPTLKAETRTVPVRLELANPGFLLKPGMFAQVELSIGSKAKVVTVPLSAVIDSGTRQVVLIDKGAGRFEPREVRLGARSDSHVEIMEGVKDGEPVVVAANFLIDAESNLKAAVGGFGHSAHGAAPAPGAASGQAAPVAAASGHRASGTLDAIDAKAGTVTVSHGPVASLKWPAMTMDFVLANPALAEKIKPGSAIGIEFVERKPGEWVITKLEAAAKPATPAAAASAKSAHQGH